MIRPEKITHKELCMATVNRFNKQVSLYEYKSAASSEEPDVLVFDDGRTYLFEIKTSLADFKRDQYKDCRKKYRFPYWAHQIGSGFWKEDTVTRAHIPIPKKNAAGKVLYELKRGTLEVQLIEKEHLGNERYYVCPWGLISLDIIPEGWGLYWYKGGKFFRKKKSGKWRSNKHRETALLTHALRRFASGDSTGILINTYGGE